MSEKSHVSMEQQVCEVCGKTFDTGVILLDRRLRASMERHTTTGLGLCEEDKAKYDEGYIALVETDQGPEGRDRLQHHEAYRSGRIAHMKFEVATEIFSIPLEENGVRLHMVYIDPEAFEKICQMAGKEPEDV